MRRVDAQKLRDTRAYVEEYTKQNKKMPTLREVMSVVGIAKTTAAKYLRMVSEERKKDTSIMFKGHLQQAVAELLSDIEKNKKILRDLCDDGNTTATKQLIDMDLLHVAILQEGPQYVKLTSDS